MKELFDMALLIALVLLVLTTFMVLYRLIIGPSLADRVTAFDVLTCVVIGMFGVFSIRTDNFRYIDVVLTMSFVVFLGAIAFSYYLRKQGRS
jgi:multicomponent Na+:H+ antiporter subunit F